MVGSALLFAGVAGACAQIAALDEFGDVDTGGAGAVGAGGGGGTPDPSCVAMPPSGWLGPVAFRIAEDPVLLDCDPGWPVLAALGGMGPPGGDLMCDECVCMPPTGVSCTTVSAGLYPNDPGCGMGQQLISPTTTCADHGPINAHSMGFTPVPSPGACEATGGEILSEPAAFGEHGVVCSPEGETASCDGGVSVPGFAQPNDWATCIYQVGSLVNCPAGSAYDKGPYVVASQYEDNRHCTGCECDPPVGAMCSQVITETYGLADCDSFAGQIVHNDTCSDTQWTIRSYRLMDDPTVVDPGACAPTQASTSEGLVEVQEEVTVCCIGAS
jgi:hypothetical protein